MLTAIWVERFWMLCVVASSRGVICHSTRNNTAAGTPTFDTKRPIESRAATCMSVALDVRGASEEAKRLRREEPRLPSALNPHRMGGTRVVAGVV